MLHIVMLKQTAIYEQRKWGSGQMAENHTSCNQPEPLDRQRKAGTSRLTGNHMFWGDKGPEC